MIEGESLCVENVICDGSQFTVFVAGVTAYVDLRKSHALVGNMTWSRYLVLTRWPFCDRSTTMSMVWALMTILRLCIKLYHTSLHTYILLMLSLSSRNGLFQKSCLMWRFFRLLSIPSVEENEENVSKVSVRISRAREGINVQFTKPDTRELHVWTTTNPKEAWLNL